MKKYLMLFAGIAILAWCINFCHNNDKAKDIAETTPVQKEFKIKKIIKEFLRMYPRFNDNDLQRKEGAKNLGNILLMNLGDSIPCISELPMKFEAMYEYRGKYIVKFTYSDYDEAMTKYPFSINAYSIVNKNTAMLLKDNSRYHFYGSSYGFLTPKTLSLHTYDGKPYYDLPEIDNSGRRVHFYLGGIIVENLSLIHHN